MEIANRSVYRGQITKLTNSASDYLKLTESRASLDNVNEFDSIEEEVTVFIQRISAARENLNKTNEEIRATLKPEEFQKEFEGVADYEDKAVGIICRLNQRLAKMREIQGKSIPSNLTLESVTKSTSLKLPQLSLRKFNGDHNEWLPFWEQFRSAVHENQSLSGADKFNYLQSVLVGKAADSIAGFTPTASCYDGAIALLVEEYGSTEKLIDKNMLELMSIQPVSSKKDIINLRRLYNCITSCTRTLTALGVPSAHYSVMLKTVLLKCMPNELRVDFHRYNNDNDNYHSSFNTSAANQTQKRNDDDASTSTAANDEESIVFEGDRQVSRILKFLKREVESLEKSAELKPPITQTSSNVRMAGTAAGLIAAMDRDKCFFCSSSHHTTSDCNGSHSVAQRKELLKRDRRCFRCTKKGHTSKFCSNKNVHCIKCNRKHASSMCDPSFKANSQTQCNIKKSESSGRSSGAQTTNLYTTSDIPQTNVYLQTACAFISRPGQLSSAFVRIILDGGSQYSYITESASRKLNLPIEGKQRLCLLSFGDDKRKPKQSFNRVSVTLKSQHNDKTITISAVEVPTICLDVLPVPTATTPEFCKFKLADDRSINNELEEGINMLIGSDYYWMFVTGAYERISNNLTAVETLLGWVIQGPATSDRSCDDCCLTTTTLCSCDIYNQFDVKYIWDLECIGINGSTGESEFLSNENLENYITKKDKYYEAKLLWKNNDFILNSHREGALTRFRNLTRKLLKDANRLKDYENAMTELISSGVAERAEDPKELCNRLFYLPHREDKSTTKLRIVFDASACSNNNLSLNDHLEAGPNLIPDILKVLLKFRAGLIAVVADIEKAFLQIHIAEQDRDVHRFFWYADKIRSTEILPPIQEFRMTRVTFGVKCSPFLLAITIRTHLGEKRKEYPEICELLMESFYMDDLIFSVNDEVLAVKVYNESYALMRDASMNLRKWNSNSYKVRTSFNSFEDCPPVQKVLGILWYVLADEMAVDLEPAKNFLKTSMVGTKRLLLQLISRIFDPLGLLGPFLIKLEIIFQDIWRLKLTWDEMLASPLQETWMPVRHFLFRKCFAAEMYASLQAYGTVAYIRCINENGDIYVRYLASKNRVAPLKQSGMKELTLPRLELTAALIAARLGSYLIKSLGIEVNETIFWSDSKIVLYWIRGEKRNWKPYITHRIKEIHHNSNVRNWRHCPGNENPADFLTRGISAKALKNSSIWLNGPAWLWSTEELWPKEDLVIESISTVLTCFQHYDNSENCSNVPISPVIDIHKYSNYRRLLRITSYVQRFADSIKNKQRITGYLKASELSRAEEYWIKIVQNQIYNEEIKSLRQNKFIKKGSSIHNLNPVLDDNEILRVGSRLHFLEEEFDVICPVILPKSSHLTKLIVDEVHRTVQHGGANIILAELRKRFWIPAARQLIKSITNKCIVCKRLRGKPATQAVAPLPRTRLLISKPFDTTGIDFAGPIYVHTSTTECVKTKVYIMLFTCAVVRAVHLELVPSISTEYCLLGLRRFIARRGIPSTIMSDNAKAFKRASLEFANFGKIIMSEEFQGFAVNKGIKWEFIVERSPWWGGFWERLVKCVKDVLKAAIGRSVLNSQQLHTLLTEAESIVNSRPLTFVSDDPLDLSPLTPSHFLTGSFASNLTFNESESTSQFIRKFWNCRLRASQYFWKRWKSEYIQLLRSAHNSKVGTSYNVRAGDIVLVYDASLPRVLWKLAIVETTFPGRDGRIRACEVRFHNGVRMRRPIQLLYPLELHLKSASIVGPEDVENTNTIKSQRS